MRDDVEGRRDFLAAAAALLAIGALRPARAAKEKKEDEAHAVDPPPSLEFRTLSFDKTPMLNRPATAIAAVPRGLRPGERLPLSVLLPGGEHTKQRHDHGCWAWWSDFRLGEVETALRRGTLGRVDFRDHVRDDQLADINAGLAKQPYRGSIIVTPFVINRQTNIVPHGSQVTPFLRQLVTRVRAELPVIPTREATGIAGASVGGLWALYCGSALAELFSVIVGVQPFTEDLEHLLRKAVKARAAPQRIRLVTAHGDRLTPMTTRLTKLLRADGAEVELVDYPGDHNREFPGGPGGIDMMLTLDRALSRVDPSPPSVPATSASASAPPAPSTPPPTKTSSPPTPPASTPARGHAIWVVALVAGALLACGSVVLGLRKRAERVRRENALAEPPTSGASPPDREPTRTPPA